MKLIKLVSMALLPLGFILSAYGEDYPATGSFPVPQWQQPVVQDPPVQKFPVVPGQQLMQPAFGRAGQFPPVVPSYRSGVPAPAFQPAPSAFPPANYGRAPMMGQSPYKSPMSMPPMGYQTPNYQFSKMAPFGNSFSPNTFFSDKNFPKPWTDSNMWNPWKNGNNSSMPFFPQSKSDGNKKNAWGDVRHIWPDFYTEFTEEFWDTSINAPYDVGRMPGGWRAPSFSSPDPVTVGDAVLNQFPPIMEEMGNMTDFSN